MNEIKAKKRTPQNKNSSVTASVSAVYITETDRPHTVTVLVNSYVLEIVLLVVWVQTGEFITEVLYTLVLVAGAVTSDAAADIRRIDHSV